MSQYKKRRYSHGKKRTSDQEKIKDYIIKNTKNGYFTRVSTIARRFEIPTSKTWEIIGELLVDESIESYHDHTGEMKVCGYGQVFRLLNQVNKNPKSKFHNKHKPV